MPAQGRRSREALREGLGALDGVDVEDSHLHAARVQHPGHGGTELAEAQDGRDAPVQDVATRPDQRLGREHHGLTDKVVLRVLQGRAGD